MDSIIPLPTRFLRLGDDTFLSPRCSSFRPAPGIATSIHNLQTPIWIWQIWLAENTKWILYACSENPGWPETAILGVDQRIEASGDATADDEALQKLVVDNWELWYIRAVLYWGINSLQIYSAFFVIHGWKFLFVSKIKHTLPVFCFIIFFFFLHQVCNLSFGILRELTNLW